MITDGLFINRYKRNSWILLFLSILIVLLTRYVKPYRWIGSYQWRNYVIPSLWLMTIFCYVYIVPKVHSRVIMIKRVNIYLDAFVCALLFVGLRFVVGIFLYKVGKTPYDFSPRGILLNILTVLLPFIGIELIRSYIINAYGIVKNNLWVITLVVILTTIFDVNFGLFQTLKDTESVTMFLAQSIGPSLCKNILLSYFALYGGALASMIYGGLLLVFHWFFPVLPELNWLSEGVIGILVPVVYLYYITSKYEKNILISKIRAETERKNVISWFATMIISVGLIWFVVGVFPVYPTVIVTGSMIPLIYPGDIALVKKFNTEEEIRALGEGDIIVFQRDDIVITHRILNVLEEEDGTLSYITKGDNNSVKDTRVVHTDDLKGIYVQVIPKLGYPTLWLKSNILEHRRDVEN